MIEDDEEQMKEELKEAFRIYDKEVNTPKTKPNTKDAFICILGNRRAHGQSLLNPYIFSGSGFHHKRCAEGHPARN